MAVTLDTTKRIQKAEDPGIKNSQNHKGYVNKEQPQQKKTCWESNRQVPAHHWQPSDLDDNV